MHNIKVVYVYAFERRVGTLAQAEDSVAFEYDAGWLASGFSLSPLSLPLERRVFIAPIAPNYGLHGVFADSLPDGWGRLLLDRKLRQLGEDPADLGPLDRLALVGNSGMGALEYRPARTLPYQTEQNTFDALAGECRKILADEASDCLDELFRLGGSSGGARPKALIAFEDGSWLVKFPTTAEGASAGLMEYDYMSCAQACGLQVPPFRLIPSDLCKGYFAVKRFDRVGNLSNSIQRVHMVSAAGLLETTHRTPNLDYLTLMKLTSAVCNDASQLKELFTRMCFNVFAHNRDDHSKNFSYLHTGKAWVLSPAYDLTYSSSMGGEHATTVAGNGKNPSMSNILEVAKLSDLDVSWATATACRVQECVNKMLGKYLS